jgi:ferredoxin
VIKVTTNGGLTASSTITVSISSSSTVSYTVNSSYCTGCGNCRSVCPSGAITISGRKAYIDQSKCTACGKCYTRCGRGAIVKTVTNN